MNVDTLFKSIVTIQTLFIVMSTYLLALVLRRILESTWEVLLVNGKVKATKTGTILWNEYLWLSPILIGGLLGLMTKTFLWPDITNGTLWGRVFYGALCGFFSAFVYARVRSTLKSFSPKDSPTDAKTEDEALPTVPVQHISLTPPPLPTVEAEKVLSSTTDTK